MKNFNLLLIFTLFISFNSFCQTEFNVGDDVEYFDGLNWIESKIIQKGDKKYLIYLDRSDSKTGWIPADDIQILFKDDAPIIKRTVEVTESVVMPKYHVEDFVTYLKGGMPTLTTIMSLGDDYMYQLFTDTNKVGTIWLAEKDITLVSSKYENEVINKKEKRYTFQVKDVLEYFDGTSWKRGTLMEINSEGKFKFSNSDLWFSAGEIRNLNKDETVPLNVKLAKEGDKVIVFDGKSWIESEIIQIDGDKVQVYYNRKQSITKWAEAKDLQILK